MTYVKGVVRRLRTAWGDAVGDERGDVPGWVLITLMTAGLPAVTACGRFAAAPVS